MPKFPVKVYYLRENGTKKILTAKDGGELNGLLKIGWKLEEAKDGSS